MSEYGIKVEADVKITTSGNTIANIEQNGMGVYIGDLSNVYLSSCGPDRSIEQLKSSIIRNQKILRKFLLDNKRISPFT